MREVRLAQGYPGFWDGSGAAATNSAGGDAGATWHATSRWQDVLVRGFGLTDAEEGDAGPAFPAGFAVPELDIFNVAAISRKIYRSGAATVGNTLADVEAFFGAITEVHHDAIELDGTAFDAELNSTEPTFMLADMNDIVIHGSIDVAITEEDRFATLGAKRTTENQQNQKRCRRDQNPTHEILRG